MRRVCAWCGEDLDPGQERADPTITHGICERCNEHFFGDLDLPPLQRFLDRLGAPVLLVDGEGVVRTANRAARRALGKDLPEIAGFPGGDVFECAHARRPGGCGRTDHCAACTIRNTVRRTHATGEPAAGVEACQEVWTPGSVHRVRFRISAERVGEVVLLRLDEVPTEVGGR